MAYTSLSALFTDIANAIRAKLGTSAAISADDFPSQISAIATGSVQFATATVAGNDTISIDFTGLLGEPKMYVVTATTSGANLSDTSKKYIVATCFTGTTGTGSHWGAVNRYQSSNWQIRYSTTSAYWNHTYSNGTLTVTSGSASNAGVFFKNQTYKLFYAY